MAVGHQGIQCIFLISFTPVDRTRLRKPPRLMHSRWRPLLIRVNIKTKKIIAREILVFLVPLIAFIALGLLIALYLSSEQGKTYDKYQAIQEEIRIERKNKVDSLRRADEIESVRLIEEMKTANESQDNIELVKRHIKNKTYDPNGELTNFYGDTVKVNSTLLQQRSELELSLDNQRDVLNNFTGQNIYDGVWGLIYGLFLILVYPIRFLIYVLIWAVRTLRTS